MLKLTRQAKSAVNLILASGSANALILDHDAHKELAGSGTAAGSGLVYAKDGHATATTLASDDFGYRQFPYAGAGMHHKIYVRDIGAAGTVKFYAKVAGAAGWTELNGTAIVGSNPDVLTTSQLTDPPYGLIKIEITGGTATAQVDVQSWGALK